MLGSTVLEGSATLHSPERRAGIPHPPEEGALSKTQPLSCYSSCSQTFRDSHSPCLPNAHIRGPAHVSPHSGPPSRLSPCCPSLSWTDRKKGQRPFFHIMLCPGLLVVLQSLETPSSAHIPCFPHPLLPQPSCRDPAPETRPARLPTAELFEDTDAVLLISASPGPSPGSGRQQLVEKEAGSFPEPAFPFLAGLVPSRARPQRQGLPGAL